MELKAYQIRDESGRIVLNCDTYDEARAQRGVVLRNIFEWHPGGYVQIR